MANAPNTKSTLSSNGVNKTSTSLSTNIIIMVNGTPVGAVQTMSIDESREIKMIDEIGTDGHIDSTPVKSTDITGQCTRIRFDRLRITEAFSRGFVHAASQAYPFDIVILDKQKRDQGSQISTIIKNVWIDKISFQYQVSDWTIVETMGWKAETIYSILNNGNGQAVAVGGERGITHMGSGPNGTVNIISGGGITNVEQLTDTGNRRGSLDAAGLIDIGSAGDLF
jgi:hypothetical protein